MPLKILHHDRYVAMVVRCVCVVVYIAMVVRWVCAGEVIAMVVRVTGCGFKMGVYI